MSDPLRSSQIDRYLDVPTSQGDLYMDVSDDESVEDLLYNDNTDDDPDYCPSEDSEMYVVSADEQSVNDSSTIPDNEQNTSQQSSNTDRETDVWHTFEGKQKMFPFTLQPQFNFNVPNNPQPIDFFEKYLNEDVVNLMVDETNRNANDVISKRRLSRQSRLRNWKDTDPEEIKKFIGLLIYMGLVPLPHITDYWSKNKLYRCSVAAQVMSRNRFQLLLRFWHFNDNNNLRQDGRIGKIKPLLDKLNALFHDMKVAERDLAIDETMIPFRGRLLFRQYIPGKSHKYGIKIFKLCDKSGYTYAVKLYMGKGTVDTTENSVATAIVMELMEKSLNKGHNLYADNYYTSVPLASLLISNNTHLAGTLRSNRKELPKNLLKQNISKGEMLCFENDDGIVITKWKDQRDVLMISTVHNIDFVEVQSKYPNKPSKLKPLVVYDYNKAKVGIDLSDQMSSYCTAVRKTMRWFHKVGEELILGTSVVNSWLAYCSFLKSKMPANEKKKHLISITKYKELLATSLMGLQEEPRVPPVSVTGHHYLTSSPFVGEGAKKRRSRKVCKSCYQKLSTEKGRSFARNMTKVTTFCSECPDRPFLCEPCFKDIHK